MIPSRAAEDHPSLTTDERRVAVRRGLRLNDVTIAWNGVEAGLSLVVGILAGSVALVGFGLDSVIELAASGAARWRLRAEANDARRAYVEARSRVLTGWTFIALTAYIALDAARALWLIERPERSLAGIVVLAVSAIGMPLLARAKRRVASGLASPALRAEATQTSLCGYLSLIALAGVALNAAFGWWWADPLAALAMTPIIAAEGLENLRGDKCD